MFTWRNRNFYFYLEHLNRTIVEKHVSLKLPYASNIYVFYTLKTNTPNRPEFNLLNKFQWVRNDKNCFITSCIITKDANLTVKIGRRWRQKPLKGLSSRAANSWKSKQTASNLPTFKSFHNIWIRLIVIKFKPVLREQLRLRCVPCLVCVWERAGPTRTHRLSSFPIHHFNCLLLLLVPSCLLVSVWRREWHGERPFYFTVFFPFSFIE